MNGEDQKKFMYLFERLDEPLYMGPKGPRENLMMYNVPMDGMSQDARERINVMLTSSIGNKASHNEVKSQIMVRKPREMPDLRGIGMAVPRSDQFSYFMPTHRDAENQLYNILMSQPSTDDFLNMSAMTRDNPNVNSSLWLHAVSRAALNRKDMKGVRMPPIREVMPDLFLPAGVISQAAKMGKMPVEKDGKPMRQVITINGPMTDPNCLSEADLRDRNQRESRKIDVTIDKSFSGRNENPENKVGYFREDLGIASHHYHFHLVYVVSAPAGLRNRKGELFYYMHHGMLARYDAERLSNGLTRAVPLDIAGNPMVTEAYFPKLRDMNSGQNWGNRQANTPLVHVKRNGLNVSIEDIRRWKDRILDAIDVKMVLTDKGEKLPLDESNGIDILGSIIEASQISVNMGYYGNLHNMGHVIIGLSHDPLSHHGERFGPMGSEATACRDPVFWRWHKFIDEIFDKYKQTLPPYDRSYLVWSDVVVANVEVQTENEKDKNVLVTRWGQRDMDLSRGLDLNRMEMGGKIWARYTHLDNIAFQYNITVNNVTTQPVTGTFRIFMAPRLNEHGEQLQFSEQRTMFFEMDKFWEQIKPGTQTIFRKSTQSSVTVDWDQTFSDLDQPFMEGNDRAAKPQEAICACGFPQHLLLPRGTAEGMPFDLFVMVTDARNDAIKLKNPKRPPCKEAYSFCGRLDEDYPDRKPMGFPFDRRPQDLPSNVPGGMGMPVTLLENFIPSNSNMNATEVRIYHRNCTVVHAAKETLGMAVLPAMEDQEEIVKKGQAPPVLLENSNMFGRPQQLSRGQGSGPVRFQSGNRGRRQEYANDSDEDGFFNVYSG